jgi:ABC-type lipoprotein release transport system permease subunit
MIGLYNEFFRFPVLLYRLSSGVALAASAVALVAAALGAVFAVRRAVAVPPAEAMRPEAPARYRRSAFERSALGRHLTHAGRMVLRNLERHPWRATATVVGIAFAVGILLFGFVFLDVMTLLADLQFSLVQRQDATVSFVEPVSARALYELRALPGVMQVEPVRQVPARLRHGHRVRHLSVVGSPAAPELNRIVTLQGSVLSLPTEGLLLSQILGEILGVGPGDEVQVEVLEGARPVRRVPVAGLVEDALGINAWMEIGALHRLLREGGSLSGAQLLVDPARLEVVSDLLSTDAVKVRPGARVRIEQWGGERPLLGRVRRVEPSGFMKISALGVEEQRVNVIVDFEDPAEAWKALGDGYRVEVRIVVWEAPDTLKVPTGSLFRRGDAWAVFAVDGGRARLRTVELGPRNGQEAQVLSGVAPGERIVVHPSDTLQDGSRVTPRGAS